mmetsp:Transcript_3562/g.6508  ORF Transcript_3562/g.6508 Transcript_3562/m.6508 type:complete len:360 (-) Transcript_3562:264-1343(-)
MTAEQVPLRRVAATWCASIVFWALVSMMCVRQLGVTGVLIEEERMQEYEKRGYSWPPKEYVPETEGWRNLMERRFSQMERLDNDGRYDGFMQVVSSAYVVPNFTENGWGLTRAPESLMEDLRAGIRDGLPNARTEHEVDVITGDRPLFIDNWPLAKRVLHELLPMHEAWVGMDLVPHKAYGFRLYRNQSSLLMHSDQSQTHVISCILHIDSSEDAEPWPIVIEDFQGNTNEVILTSGDMLFYESSKCLHGRPKKFNGSWYSSIFVHYYPTGEWTETDHALENHYGVPAHWFKVVRDDDDARRDKLVMKGTSSYEPNCKDNWCALEDSVKLSGPAEEGYVITTGNKKFPLYPEKEERDEL